MGQYIYICSNESIPGKVKIGKTEICPHRRIAALQTTGVPTPFELIFSAEVNDCHVSERAIHSALANFRSAHNREFFNIGPEDAVKEVLAILDDYKLHFSAEDSNCQTYIEADQEKRLKLAREKEANRRLEQAQQKEVRQREILWQQREARFQEFKSECLEKIRTLEEKELAQFGPTPKLDSSQGLTWGIGTWLVSVGAWHAAIGVIGSENGGGIFGFLLFCGVIAASVSLWAKYKTRLEKELQRELEPRRPLRREMESLRSKIQDEVEHLRRIGHYKPRPPIFHFPDSKS
ncbi:GIY-YIG nuclease family protein [Marinobacter nauticus]|jgi:Skp family chaperone for outer membrane proteins|uniref:Bacteriophage T5 Orf172 DNA-binding domain-containing protein n=1 Tax=Marinobacter nauticus TaxID=2743 RepID=A0A833JPD3_MARNT|nr:GIY-YIG nuclease family protein [Marinobacter nauticus]KAE8543780.1 hypothetical protein F6453_3889 [Marinobacter nauticus]